MSSVTTSSRSVTLPTVDMNIDEGTLKDLQVFGELVCRREVNGVQRTKLGRAQPACRVQDPIVHPNEINSLEHRATAAHCRNGATFGTSAGHRRSLRLRTTTASDPGW